MIKELKLNYNYIRSYLKKNSISKLDSIIISLSGGLDSIVLFNLLCKFFILKPKNVHLVIFNHNKRVETEYEINNMISFYGLKKKYNIKIITIKSISKTSFQKKSREIRFKKIINYSIKMKIKHIFFGHHFDDLLETFFMRKIQLSGINGLNNMFSINHKKLIFHRPLLQFTKNEIFNFALKNKLRWYEDRTNNDLNFSRNKIRSYLSKGINKKNILNYSKQLNQIKFLNKHLSHFIKLNKNHALLEKEVFIKLPNVLQKYLIYMLFTNFFSSTNLRDSNFSNICSMINNKLIINKKRSIKGGFIENQGKLLNFIFNKPFKEKKL